MNQLRELRLGFVMDRVGEGVVGGGGARAN